MLGLDTLGDGETVFVSHGSLPLFPKTLDGVGVVPQVLGSGTLKERSWQDNQL